MPRRKLPAPATPDSTELMRSRLEQEFNTAIELYGDPRLKMLDLADRALREEDLPTAGRLLAEVAQYVAPKLRAMEVQANVTSTQVVFNIDLSADEEETTVDAEPIKRD